MNELERVQWFNELFDCYGSCLTKTQQEVFEDYYINNFSYQEIADNRQVSKSAIYDTLKRIEKILSELEANLKLNQLIQGLKKLKNPQVDQLLRVIQEETK